MLMILVFQNKRSQLKKIMNNVINVSCIEHVTINVVFVVKPVVFLMVQKNYITSEESNKQYK